MNDLSGSPFSGTVCSRGKQTEIVYPDTKQQREKNSDVVDASSPLRFFLSPSMVFPSRDGCDPDCLSYASCLIHHSHGTTSSPLLFPQPLSYSWLPLHLLCRAIDQAYLTEGPATSSPIQNSTRRDAVKFLDRAGRDRYTGFLCGGYHGL